MTWIALTVILGLLGAAAFLIGRSITRDNAQKLDAANKSTRTDGYGRPLVNTDDLRGGMRLGRFISYGGGAVCLALWLLVTVFSATYQLDTREVSVIKSFGEISSTESSPGFHVKPPWASVEKYDTGLQEYVPGDISASASDNQEIVIQQFGVNYQVDPNQVETLARTVGANWREVLIPKRVQQVVKDNIVKFGTTQVAVSRAQLRAETTKALNAELDRYGIQVVDVFYTNIGLPSELTKAITAKQVEDQNALAAINITKRKSEENTQRVNEAKATAEANRALAASLETSPELLQIRLAEERTKQIMELAKSGNIQLVPSESILNLNPRG